MHRRLRTLAALVAGLALVAALPAPCGCAPGGAPGRAADHACCAPPLGVSAADDGCCDEAPDLAEAVPAPATSADVLPVAFALPHPGPSCAPRPGSLASRPVHPSPPTVLRI